MFQNGSTPADNGSIRADSGGLALRYFQPNISNFYACVYNCSFINGTVGRRLDAETILANFLSAGVNSGLNQNRFTGRGGGMGVYINADNSSVTVTVRNCLFKNNYADLFGGGLYLFTGGKGSNHSVLVEGTHFINNSVAAAGGAIQMALLVQNVGVPGSEFNYTNCTFISNGANYGGAVSAIQTYVFGRGNIVNMKRCDFIENHSTDKGSAITFASLLYPENVEEPYSYSITDWYVVFVITKYISFKGITFHKINMLTWANTQKCNSDNIPWQKAILCRGKLLVWWNHETHEKHKSFCFKTL